MQNPWKELSVKEWWLWSISMLIVTVSNLVTDSVLNTMFGVSSQRRMK